MAPNVLLPKSNPDYGPTRAAPQVYVIRIMESHVLLPNYNPDYSFQHMISDVGVGLVSAGGGGGPGQRSPRPRGGATPSRVQRLLLRPLLWRLLV